MPEHLHHGKPNLNMATLGIHTKHFRIFQECMSVETHLRRKIALG